MAPALTSANPELRRLAEAVVATSATANAGKTLKSYTSQLRMFWQWTAEHHIDCTYPIPVPVAAAYLRHRAETVGCAGTVRQSNFALKYAHTTLGLPDPTDDRVVRNVVAVAEKTLPANVNRTSPVTPDMVAALLRKLQEGDMPLVERVILTEAVFAFFTFARFDDMNCLLAGDVIEFDAHWEVYFDKAKNDQRRNGNLVRLDKHVPEEAAADQLSFGGALQLLQHEVAKAAPEHQRKARGKRALFPRVVRGTLGMQPVSRTEFVRVMRKTLTALGYEARDYTPHSFRIGGMTTADAMGEAFDLMMQHGRWRSAEAARRYISQSVSKAVSVSKALNKAVARPDKVPKLAVASGAAIAKNKQRRRV